MNMKSCLSHDEDEEEMAKKHPSLAAPPPPTQVQQWTPQSGRRTPLRSDNSPSPSTSKGADLSASTSRGSTSESGKRFRSLNEIYEQETTNECMNSLFSFYCHVDDPIHFEEAVKDKKLINAMDEEINSIEKNKTWELVDLQKRKEVIGVKWVYKTKSNAEGKIERHKARLVVKGYKQQQGRDYEENFAPVARIEKIRAVLSIIAQHKWKVYQMDVKSTFLNGVLMEEIYV